MVTGNRRNAGTAVILGGVVVGMVAMTYAAVPLYRLFCQVTGFGGTTQTAAVASGATGDRLVTVRFNADTMGSLPWQFRPTQREMILRVGEEALAFYRAENPTDRTITGNATFNVTPHKAGQYFDKIDCFCFERQVLTPGESMKMAVSFFIDPAILEDRNLDDVKSITLSYTFFEVDSDETQGSMDAIESRRTSALVNGKARVNCRLQNRLKDNKGPH